MSKNIVIVGAGGYAQEVLWVIDDINAIKTEWNFLGYIDPGGRLAKGEVLYDRPVLGCWADWQGPLGTYFCCGIGDPNIRKKEAIEAERLGLRPATLIHPTVVVAKHVFVGDGTVVGANSILSPYATIGRHCALNVSVGVGHNSTVGDYSVLSPHAQVLGSVTIEPEVFLGANSTVMQRRRMGHGSSLGANSFLVKSVEAGISVFGVPAKRIGKTTGAGICTNMETIRR